MTAFGTDSCYQRPRVIVTADTMQRKRNQQPNCLDFLQIPRQALCLILVGNTKLDKHQDSSKIPPHKQMHSIPRAVPASCQHLLLEPWQPRSGCFAFPDQIHSPAPAAQACSIESDKAVYV